MDHHSFNSVSLANFSLSSFINDLQCDNKIKYFSAISQNVIVGDFILTLTVSTDYTGFYNAELNEWTPGPSLLTPRGDLTCGILMWRNPDSNILEKIVVAAGGYNDSDNLNSVELLYLNDDAIDGGWVVGPDLPKDSYKATMVEYNNTVILIGGSDRPGGSGYPYLYQLSSPKESWVTMKQRLKVGRSDHVSFLVPDEIVNCHK